MARPAGRNDPLVLLVKWCDVTKWLLGRVDSFPKNQRFIFGHPACPMEVGPFLVVSSRFLASDVYAHFENPDACPEEHRGASGQAWRVENRLPRVSLLNRWESGFGLSRRALRP